MKITVFGASGKVGRRIVELALAENHDVTVLVHRHNPFEGMNGVLVVRGSITDEKAVRQALNGSDAVFSALGSWGTKSKDILSSGMATILPGMESVGIRRIITLTGAGALWSEDNPGPIDRAGHALFGLVAGKILTDSERHLAMLEASSLDWTCVRSPVMTPFSNTDYRLQLGLVSPAAFVPRASVVRCMIDQLTDREFIAKAPIIVRA